MLRMVSAHAGNDRIPAAIIPRSRQKPMPPEAEYALAFSQGLSAYSPVQNDPPKSAITFQQVSEINAPTHRKDSGQLYSFKSLI